MSAGRPLYCILKHQPTFPSVPTLRPVFGKIAPQVTSLSQHKGPKEPKRLGPAFAGGFAAIRKGAGLFCGSFPRKGEAFAYVGLFQNLKDLKDEAFAYIGRNQHPNDLKTSTRYGRDRLQDRDDGYLLVFFRDTVVVWPTRTHLSVS